MNLTEALMYLIVGVGLSFIATAILFILIDIGHWVAKHLRRKP